jgi:hypothetical protein
MGFGQVEAIKNRGMQHPGRLENSVKLAGAPLHSPSDQRSNHTWDHVSSLTEAFRLGKCRQRSNRLLFGHFLQHCSKIPSSTSNHAQRPILRKCVRHAKNEKHSVPLTVKDKSKTRSSFDWVRGKRSRIGRNQIGSRLYPHLPSAPMTDSATGFTRMTGSLKSVANHAPICAFEPRHISRLPGSSIAHVASTSKSAILNASEVKGSSQVFRRFV